MKKGFTLAELLIALVILGVIATFTIPKVLQNQQDSQRKAVLKESIAVFTDIVHTGLISGTLTDPMSGNVMAYFSSRLNAVKICPSNASGEGCWSHAAPGPNFATQLTEGGFILHNGATVAGFFSSGPDYEEHFAIDWNGATGPNQEGQDQIMLTACWRATGTCTGGVRRDAVVGRVSNPVSVTMYSDVFAP